MKNLRLGIFLLMFFGVGLYFFKDVPLKKVIIHQQDLFILDNILIQMFFLVGIFCVIASIGYLLHRYVITFKNTDCTIVAEFTRLSALVTLPTKIISRNKLKDLLIESPHRTTLTSTDQETLGEAIEKFNGLLKTDL